MVADMNTQSAKTTDASLALRPVYRPALLSDIDQLDQLEKLSFDSDRLNRRRFKHWISSDHGIFIVAIDGTKLLGYGLVIMRKGTRLARLYSIAVSPAARGLGLGKSLLARLELEAIEQGKLFMRLEVASNNLSAIALYEALGYRTFGTYSRYYDNKIDALRMQKPIRQQLSGRRWAAYPWYQQTTEFTCGPSALMMAMAHLDSRHELSQSNELDIWRQATTIFMTSGHGGCHPLGLALAARARGFDVDAYINTTEPLFIDGVRSEHKKIIMRAVDRQFLQQAQQTNVSIHYEEISVDTISEALQNDSAIISLISTYHLDGKKIPHWVTVTGIDQDCLYLHDSDLEDIEHPMDNQHIPIAREDFHKMSGFGKSKLRTTLVLTKRSALAQRNTSHAIEE